MTKERVKEIVGEMHKIVFPGEYGLGSEKGSIPDDDKKAWERIGELVEELVVLVDIEEDGRPRGMVTKEDLMR